MKKVLGKKNLKIIAATAMTIFSLFAAVTGVYAWFVSHINEAADADLFQVSKVDTSVQEISIHAFYGTTSGSGAEYCFNPDPISAVDYSNPSDVHIYGNQNLKIELEKYSLDDPHHPVLILFKVDGVEQSIIGETVYPFLSQDMPGAKTLDANHTKATYSALPSSASGDELFEVTNDEHQNARDENGNGVKTRYRYNESKGAFELVWVDLGLTKNPLSSVIMTHSFLFNKEKPYTISGNDPVIDNNSNFNVDKTYTYIDDQGVSHTETNKSIAIPVADFKGPNDQNTNMASFVTIDGGEATYDQECAFFDGSVSGYTYLGIVVDYYSDALVYMSSELLGNDLLNGDITFKCDWIIKV